MTEIKVFTRKTGYLVSAGRFVYDVPEGVFFIDYDLQETGFGEKPLLICPRCGSRRTKLYAIAPDYIGCRGCLPFNPYNNRQNCENGYCDRRIRYTISKMLRNKGLPPIDDLLAFNARAYVCGDNKPRWMRRKTFCLLMAKVQMLNILQMQYAAGLNRDFDTQTVSAIERATAADFAGNRLYEDLLALSGVKKENG